MFLGPPTEGGVGMGSVWCGSLESAFYVTAQVGDNGAGGLRTRLETAGVGTKVMQLNESRDCPQRCRRGQVWEPDGRLSEGLTGDTRMSEHSGLTLARGEGLRGDRKGERKGQGGIRRVSSS